MTRTTPKTSAGRDLPDSRQPSPNAARRRLGAELRDLRGLADLRLDEAATRMQRSAATLSRLETGKTKPRVPDVKELLDFYGEVLPQAVTTEVRDRLVDLANDGRRSHWFSGFRDVTGGDMSALHTFVAYESDAAAFQSFEPEIIPGLIQTDGYAAAITRLWFPDGDAKQRARRVQFRLARQGVLHRSPGPLELDLIIGETALRRVIGSSAVMREQLDVIAKNIVNGQPNIRIGIAESTLPYPAAIGGPFVVMRFDEPEDDLVYIEGRSGETYFQEAEQVERFLAQFTTLREHARTGEAALAVVKEVQRKLA